MIRGIHIHCVTLILPTSNADLAVAHLRNKSNGRRMELRRKKCTSVYHGTVRTVSSLFKATAVMV